MMEIGMITDESIYSITSKITTTDHDFYEEVDRDNRCLEMRRYWITEELRTLPNTEPWRGLRSIGLVERSCLIGETETVERRFL